MKIQYNKRVIISFAILTFFTSCSTPNSLKSEVKPEPKSVYCELNMGNTLAGRIKITRIDPDPKIPLVYRYQVSRNLISGTAGIDLIAYYKSGNELPEIKTSVGASAIFVVPSGAIADKYKAEIQINDNEIVNFNNTDFTADKDEASLFIDKDTDRGKAVLSAIDNNIKFKTTIFNNGIPFRASTFYPIDIPSLEWLYKQAIKKINEEDPEFCRKM